MVDHGGASTPKDLVDVTWRNVTKTEELGNGHIVRKGYSKYYYNGIYYHDNTNGDVMGIMKRLFNFGVLMVHKLNDMQRFIKQFGNSNRINLGN